MIVTRENERLYLSAYKFNAARVFTKLAEMIQAAGGRVKPLKPARVSNRNDLNADPITVTHTDYISFVLDGFYYYYQVDDNPFFPAFYRKAKITGNKIDADTAGEDGFEGWITDQIFSNTYPAETVETAAETLLNWLILAPAGRPIRSRTRRRVANMFNSGYHYETITAPARYEIITF